MKARRALWWWLVLLVAAPIPEAGAGERARRVLARDHGAVADGESDAGPAIRAAIATAVATASVESPVEVVLDEGTYRVLPEAGAGWCFAVQSAQGVVIRGQGASTRVVVGSPSAGVFLLDRCRSVEVRDLVVDYDPVPFCQGTVRAIDVEGGSFDLDVDAGSPTPDGANFLDAPEPHGKWGMAIDRSTRRIRDGTPDHFMTPRWERREGRVWRFFTGSEHHRRNLARLRVGDAYVQLARRHGGAVLAHRCDGVRIERVTVHASPSLAVGLVANRGEILVRGLSVRFPPAGDRLLTTNADGVHCQQNRSGPIIEDCFFEGMADDGINIYAPPNVLLEVRSPREWLVGSGVIVLPGDRLQVLDPRSGRARGEVRASDVRREGRALLLTLEAPLGGVVPGADHRVADTLYDLDACGAGFRIRRSHFRGNRRYGCLLRAGEGIVEDNVFEDTTGAGVVLTNEPDWPEGPAPWNVTVRRNRFLRGGTCLGYADSPRGGALSVHASRLGHRLADASPIRGVRIEENEIVDRAGVSIFVGGAEEVVLRGNRVLASRDATRQTPGAAIVVARSSGVVLEECSIDDPREATRAAVEIAGDVPAGGAGVRIEGIEARLHGGAVRVDDRRAAD